MKAQAIMKTLGIVVPHALREDAYADKTKKKPLGWKRLLKDIVIAHNKDKADGRGRASYRTMQKREDDLFHIFTILIKELGFKLENPANIKPRHIEALVKYWVEKKLAASTIDNYLSALRVFCKWLNKSFTVKRLSEYVPGLHRTYAAQHDKSWSGNGVDFWEVWDQVFKMDRYVGMQLLCVAAFGARAKEAQMFKPVHCTRANGAYVAFLEGTKGGRPRMVPVDTPFKGSCQDNASNDT